MRGRGPARVRSASPSKGEKRYSPHRAHQPANILKPKRRIVNVVRMYISLTERQWKFNFKIEAVSPHGFKYAAEGVTPEEAFLKAFGMWKKES